jgi:hypothetical protein
MLFGRTHDARADPEPLFQGETEQKKAPGEPF